MSVSEPLPQVPLVALAEKNPRIRRFLAREFAARGWRVVLAADGAALRRAARALPRPDVFVVDLELPFLDEGLREADGAALRPLVLHALMPEAAGHPALALAGAVVEKTGDPGALLDAARNLLPGPGGPKEGA
jgi:DNA-binding response OmpR family regulator